MKTNNKINLNLDTNVVQCLYMLDLVKDGAQRLKDRYQNVVFEEILEFYENRHNFKFYITSQVYNELENCEYKLPYIVEYAKRICTIKTETNQSKLSAFQKSVQALTDLYIEKNIHIRGSTRAVQSAIFAKNKDDDADAWIVAESNHVLGIPTVTINEQHLIYMTDVVKSKQPLRSIAILKKNQEFLSSYYVDKHYKANIKSQDATTARLVDVLEI